MSAPDTETQPTLQRTAAADSSTLKTVQTPVTKATSKGLYSVVWRWHFYAGLFIAPILLVITVTGALYVFKTELTALRDHSLLVVTPGPERISHDELMQKAEGLLAPLEVEAMVVHPERHRSVLFVAHEEAESGDHHDDKHHQLYLNPYNGEVLGQKVVEEDFFHVVLQLHRNFLMGTTGRAVAELATSWGLILLATGVFLWWPRGKKNVGIWLPRIRGKLYAVLRDWHAVGGIYLLPIAALIIGTGLFFTVVLGNTFNNTVKRAGHWPAAWFGKPQSETPDENSKPASLDAVVATLIPQSLPNDSISILLAKSPEAAHQAWLLQDEDKNSYRMVAVDQYTAKSVNRVASDEVPFLYRVRLWAVSIHMGQIFGTPTKILAFITSLGLIAMTVTGVWMWWRRRPSGRAGFPRRPTSGSMPKWVWGVIIVCGIALPVAGVSMIVLGVIDFAVGRFARPETA